jgi:hypothetical protein
MNYVWELLSFTVGECLFFTPFLIIGQTLQTSMFKGFANTEDPAYKKSLNILSEAVKNFRTVASFSNQKRVPRIFKNTLKISMAKTKKKALALSIGYGISQFITYNMYGITFFLGAVF